MPRRNQPSLAAFSEALLQIHAPVERHNLPAKAMAAIRTIVSGDVLAFNEISPSGSILITDPAPPIAQAPEIFAAHIDEHPSLKYVERTGSREAVRISDFLNTQKWRKTELYNNFFGAWGLNYQLAFLFKVGSLGVGFAVNRASRDFSETERATLNLLIPHLMQAWDRAEACARQRAALAAVAVLEVDGEGRIRHSTAAAEKWLSVHFPGRPGVGDRLPSEAAGWFQQARARRKSVYSALEPAPPLIIARANAVLTISFLSSAKDDLHQLLLEEKSRDLTVADLAPLGLTAREAEVLLWVSQGKTNSEIGIIIGCKQRTVDKHLERIMQKLGVETRTAAAATAFRYLA